jgi:phosphorylated adapter RNA export protein
MELLRRTIELELRGGMLTADGARRRTPGGVFFALLKDAATRDQYKEIFAADKVRHQSRRNASARARREKEAADLLAVPAPGPDDDDEDGEEDDDDDDDDDGL